LFSPPSFAAALRFGPSFDDHDPPPPSTEVNLFPPFSLPDIETHSTSYRCPTPPSLRTQVVFFPSGDLIDFPLAIRLHSLVNTILPPPSFPLKTGPFFSLSSVLSSSSNLFFPSQARLPLPVPFFFQQHIDPPPRAPSPSKG